jgi:hypothetical protein
MNLMNHLDVVPLFHLNPLNDMEELNYQDNVDQNVLVLHSVDLTNDVEDSYSKKEIFQNGFEKKKTYLNLRHFW